MAQVPILQGWIRRCQSLHAKSVAAGVLSRLKKREWHRRRGRPTSFWIWIHRLEARARARAQPQAEEANAPFLLVKSTSRSRAADNLFNSTGCWPRCSPKAETWNHNLFFNQVMGPKPIPCKVHHHLHKFLKEEGKKRGGERGTWRDP